MRFQHVLPLNRDHTADVAHSTWSFLCVLVSVPLYLLAGIALALALYLRCAMLLFSE